ncbi:MAG: ribose-phosphate diphosphokinase [Candidatus Woesearchaeota archaeon]
MKNILVAFPRSEDLVKRIARKKKWPWTSIDIRKFPDGETNLRFRKDPKGKDLYLVDSFDEPNDDLITLLFAARTAKELKARKVFLISPYLGYMRQDKRFRPYEAVSSRIMADLLNPCLDGIMTIDPHLHRYSSLNDIFSMRSEKLTADPLIAEFVKKNYSNPVVVGPDEESYQWARKVAGLIGCEATVLKKKRYTAKHVSIKLREGVDVRGKDVIIIDDIISTGHTMAETVKDVKNAGAKRVCCICVHAIFAGGSHEMLRKLGARVVSCNTIPHKTNRIDVSGLISSSLK